MKMPELKIPEFKIPGLDFGKSDLEKFLAGVTFPAKREDLIRVAREKNVPDAVISAMEKLPEREYTSSEDVASAFGKI
ncbi:DUF2795 domain-containing protein [Methanofollis fontis]|uniref:DUF2795 domain-containing protein n=1 Tax=Methanofollis fontis TaxID=2052832 RepID=A0A483CUW2_9EURY|nr:DUF2795 domain-containing protein [Methanofollis fontis]TAJ45416.1 hypothetical protein CUJ86_01365 [Methanofollis fontis]